MFELKMKERLFKFFNGLFCDLKKTRSKTIEEIEAEAYVFEHNQSLKKSDKHILIGQNVQKQCAGIRKNLER